MNTVEDRINQLRITMGISQKGFSEKIHITQSALSQIENGKTKASTEVIHMICDQYGVNANWLMQGIGEVFAKDSIQKVSAGAKKDMKKKDPVEIPMVIADAHADYPKNVNNTKYLGNLVSYKIPGFEEGNFRMFEVSGDSMEDTLYDGEIAITEFIEDFKNLRDGQIYVLISNEGVLIKRVFIYQNGIDAVICRSDNQKYPSFNLQFKDVLELWEVKAKLTAEFLSKPLNEPRKYFDMDDRIRKLEQQINELNKKGQEDRADNNEKS